MQEITLSNNLEILTDEILSFGRHINKSYWEIGRRLNFIKENNLVHGEFLNYLEKVKIQRDDAYKLMQIAKLPNIATLQYLPKTSLFLIATLPDEAKQEQIERIEKGDSPTVRELQEVRRQLNLARAANENLREKNERLAEQALKGLEKKTVTKEVVKEVEVFPADYNEAIGSNLDLMERNKELVDRLDSVERSLKMKEAAYRLLEQETSEAIALKDSLEHLKADKQKLETSVANVFELSNLATEFETFFDERMAPLRFKALIQGAGKEIQIDKIRQLLTLTENWLSEMNKIVPEKGRTIVEGEIVNE